MLPVLRARKRLPDGALLHDDAGITIFSDRFRRVVAAVSGDELLSAPRNTILGVQAKLLTWEYLQHPLGSPAAAQLQTGQPQSSHNSYYYNYYSIIIVTILLIILLLLVFLLL